MVSLVLHGSIGVVLTAIVAVGWARQRRLGFLVLIAWALVSMFSGPVVMFTGVLQPFMAKLFPGVDRTILMLVPSMLGYLVSSILLATGLALLVFRKDGRGTMEKPGT